MRLFPNFTDKQEDILSEYLSLDDIYFLNGIASDNGVNIIDDINKIELSEKLHYSIFVDTFSPIVLVFEFNENDCTLLLRDIIICKLGGKYFNRRVKLVDYSALINILLFCDIKIMSTYKDETITAYTGIDSRPY